MATSLRLQQKEQLDNLALSGKALRKTLWSLKLINHFFGCHKQLIDGVVETILEDDYFLDNILGQIHGEENTIRIVDLGSGGGDCIMQLNQRFAKQNIVVNFTGIDGNPHSTKLARDRSDYLNTRFITADILSPDFEPPKNDVIMSSHFVYHFEDGALIDFLKKLQTTTTKKIIFSDLRRHKFSVFLFKWFRHLLPITSIAKKDGLTAIRRSFTVDEMHEIIKKSGITDYEIIKKPWFRMLVKINLNSNDTPKKTTP